MPNERPNYSRASQLDKGYGTYKSTDFVESAGNKSAGNSCPNSSVKELPSDEIRRRRLMYFDLMWSTSSCPGSFRANENDSFTSPDDRFSALTPSVLLNLEISMVMVKLGTLTRVI